MLKFIINNSESQKCRETKQSNKRNNQNSKDKRQDNHRK